MKTFNNKSCTCDGCVTMSVLIGVIFGIITGLFFAGGFIPFITIGLWIILGVAVLALIFILRTPLFNLCSNSCMLKCLSQNVSCLLTGTIGTIITSLISLAITLNTSIIAIVFLIALTAFFFTFLIVSLIYFIRCMINNLS